MYRDSAIAIRDKFLKGEYSAVSIAHYFLNRIATLDPKIGAFLTVFNDKIIEQAVKLDKKKAANEPLGKLAGIPIALKDNILVEGELTTCASKILANYKAPYNASIVEALLKEDALIIGKTNLDEFAMGSSTGHSAFQKTYNPWNLKCSPGGSSGGSAAAVAARLCPLALGSDTGGSVRQPASFCGIIGYKPTYGRVSRAGLVAFGSSLDQISPFGTTVEDVALLMEVIGRPCAKDSTTYQEPADHYPEDFTRSLKGVKIGVPWEFLNDLCDEPRRAFESAIEKAKALGATIVNVDLSILKYSLAVYYILATAEASTNLARFDGVRYGYRSPQAKTLDEVYDLSRKEGFGAEVKKRIMLGTFVLSAGYQDAYYRKAQKVRRLILDGYKKAFESCDFIATPVSPFSAFEVGAIKDSLQEYLEDIYTIGVNLAGLPAVSLPNLLSEDKKPIGIQLIGPQKGDLQLLMAAAAFQEILPFKQSIPEYAHLETSR